jgi:hypothetical protein
LTYTDVPARRLTFFQSLLKPFGVHWEGTQARHGERLTEADYSLAVGRVDAPGHTHARALPRLSRLENRIPDRLESRTQTPA